MPLRLTLRLTHTASACIRMSPVPLTHHLPTWRTARTIAPHGLCSTVYICAKCESRRAGQAHLQKEGRPGGWGVYFLADIPTTVLTHLLVLTHSLTHSLTCLLTRWSPSSARSLVRALSAANPTTYHTKVLSAAMPVPKFTIDR